MPQGQGFTRMVQVTRTALLGRKGAPPSAQRKRAPPSADEPSPTCAHDHAGPAALGFDRPFAALSSRAFACEPKPLNDTDESFALAAAKRMTRLGVTDVEPASPLKDGGELYVLLGSNVRLAIRDDGGYPTEVGTVLSEPSNSDDRNRQVALIWAGGFWEPLT
jgi:hypothetical protein